MKDLHPPRAVPQNAIAVTGLAGRWPGAPSPAALWEVLVSGRETVSHFSEEELEWSSASEEARRKGLATVRARGILEDADKFDAEFFGIYPREAELMDPQHRLFLECAWEAMEDAAVDPYRFGGLVGVFAGLSMNTYLLSQLCAGNRFAEEFAGSYQVGNYQAMLGNDKDFLPTRISYKLNLRGPSMAIQTACSTSLVAIHTACQSLLTYQCDMALAGGASITFPQKRDYQHESEGMVSADGHCRAFDAAANGTVFGHGVGVVALRRLEDAMADGEPIHAVILGSAVNNDGSDKIGFAAPSISAQAEVVSMALAAANVPADSITCIEAHGTGTLLGDPIEVEALTRAFRAQTERTGFCALATCKTHIGHLDVAAGVTGLIKVCLQFRHGLIPKLLHYQSPNPAIDFTSTPFQPAARHVPWQRGDTPRRAGISAFGVGGTNAHVIVEEPPAADAINAFLQVCGKSEEPRSKVGESGCGPGVAPLLVSAKSVGALSEAVGNLARHLEAEPEVPMAAVARTLMEGRAEFPFRVSLAAWDTAAAVKELREMTIPSTLAARTAPLPVVFLFPGQGAQRAGMGARLAAGCPLFRRILDETLAAFDPPLAARLMDLMVDGDGHDERALDETRFAQPALFALEYSLARLLAELGLRPVAAIGHSVGEFAAACLAGILTLDDAARLVTARGAAMQAAPPGSMLAVHLEEALLIERLPRSLSLAAVNAPYQCVVSGPTAEIEAFAAKLEGEGVACSLLRTSHAFHSAMMEGACEKFREVCEAVEFQQPGEAALRIVSSATGEWLKAAQAVSPDYWAGHLREPVLFSKGAARLLEEYPEALFIEVGPGHVLSALAARQPGRRPGHLTVTTLAHPGCDSEPVDFARCLGRAWEGGHSIVWPGWGTTPKVHLPTYPFQRKSYWVRKESVREGDQKSDTTGIRLEKQQGFSEEGNAVLAGSGAEASVPVGAQGPSVEERLRKLLLDLSGIALSAADDGRSFVELGFDSLFLTQARQAVQAEFGVRVTFRQLLSDFPTISKLASHIREVGPVPVEAVGTGVIEESATGKGPLGGGSDQEAAEKPREVGLQPGQQHGPFRPARIEPEEELDERRRRALDELVGRYNRRTAGSKTYAAEHRGHFCDPRAASNFRQLWKEMVYPIVCARSKGARIWDIDGNEYIDVTLGFGVHYLGHSPDYVVEAVKRQMEAGFEIGPQSPLAGEAARRLCRMTGMDRATFCNTGSEAVMAAMRVARTVTGRDKIVYFNGDYHGMFDSVLVRGFDVDGRRRMAPIAPGIPAGQAADMLVLDYDDPRSLEILRKRAHEIAAVIVEPVQARHPDLQPREFLHQLRKWTRESGALFIFDEVITGFRCCPGGAQEWFDVEADLATYGKIVGGGIPIGVLAGRARFMDVLDGGPWRYGDLSVPEVGVTFFAGTFVRHPMAMAAACAVLEFLEASGPGLQRRTNELCAGMVERINAFLAERRCGIRLETFASLFHLHFDPALSHAGLLYYHLRDRGIHIWEGRVGFLSVAHTEADVEAIIAAFRSSVIEMQEAGFLPDDLDEARVEVVPVELSAGVAEPPSPLTEAQKELFYSAMQGDDANRAYNESNILEFRGRLDVEAMKRALSFLRDRHAALRSVFAEDGSEQRYEPPGGELPLVETDLSRLDEQAREDAFQAALRHESGTPFDLVEGPLVRFQLLRLEEEHHVLLFSAHHIVCDGWSFGMLVDELSKAYNAFKAGKDAPALPPAMPFGEYARRELASRNGAEAVAARAFWTEKFREPPEDLALPTDRPYPEVKSYAGGMEVRRLEPALYRRLAEASPSLGGTLFSTLFGLFTGFLHRLCGQDDLVVGVPAAAQTMVGCNELIGHCLNFLPIRVRIEPCMSVRGLTRAARDWVLEAYEHQDFTYGTLLRALNLPRNASRLPLVSVMFNIDRTGIDHLVFDGLKHSVRTNAKQFVNLDLFFNLVQSDDALDVECEYNADLFDRETVAGLLARFERFLGACLGEPESGLDGIALTTPDELRRVLVEWNATRDETPLVPVHVAIRKTAEERPEAVAITCGGESWSYGRLAARVRQLACHLVEGGVRRGDLVGLCQRRSPDMVASMLAILETGAAYVPMDPEYPAERVRWMIEDAKMTHALADTTIAAKMLDRIAQRIDVDTLPPDEGHGFEPRDVSLSDMAYTIFTSGSTGRPKGVQVPHEALANFLVSMAREPGMGPEDVLLAVTTVSFDISGLELLLPLVVGGHLVIASREMALDPRLLVTAIESEGVTVMQATPVTWRMMIESGWVGSPRLKALCGGEALPRALANELAVRCRELWNMYGPTETTIWSTCGRIKPGDGPVDIGKPIANTQVYILDAKQAPVAPGQAGALFIAGKGLALGYLGQPELTREKFLPNPYAGDTGYDRMYATGDLARWLPDGRIECLGRVDHQIKLRGFRIELGEIESALSSHEGVAMAVVTLREDEPGQPRLVAYVQPSGRQETGEGVGGRSLGVGWQSQWEVLFGEALKQVEREGGDIGSIDAVITGWTGESGFEEDVKEWIEATVGRLKSLQPCRVLEIGCGTGQILLRLAPQCAEYVGTDFISKAIESLAERTVGLPCVSLRCQAADDFSGLPAGRFDLVVINSVIQYFPDGHYLRDVLEGAVAVLMRGGRIFLGDVQSAELLACHHTAHQFAQMDKMSTVGELRQRVMRRMATETELVADPEYFRAVAARLPGAPFADIQLRRGRRVNETTAYHYDVILDFDSERRPARYVTEHYEWGTDGCRSLEDITRLLDEEPGRTVAVADIPDARLATDLALAAAVDAADDEALLQELAPAMAVDAVHPEDLWELAEARGIAVHLTWLSPGSIGAIFHPAGWVRPAWPEEFDVSADPTQHLREPAAGRPTAALQPADIVSELREHLAARLPEYMLPSRIVVMDKLPLTPNGKVDRKALPAPTMEDFAGGVAASGRQAPPSTPTEKKLHTIWCEVLGMEAVGIHDSFFELGGDSILSFQITARANAEGIPLTPRLFFQHRTIAAIAAALDSGFKAPLPPRIQRVARVARQGKRA